MAVLNELAGHQFIDFLFGQFGVEAPVELGEGGSFFEAGGLEPGFGEAGVSAIQLVLHQAGKHLYERTPLVGLDEPGLQGGVHAMEPESPEVFFDFSDGRVH